MRSKFGLFVFMLLAFAFPLGAQTTIRVPADQPSIQAGINAANAGDTVLVAPGTYNENIDFKGKAITVTSSGGAAVTTIDGGVEDATVAFRNAESRSSVLSNLTITGGGNGSVFGTAEGGIYILHASPTISADVITGAGCYGIASVAGAPLIQNNQIDHTHVDAATSACGDANGSGIWINGVDNTLVPFPTSQGHTPQILYNIIELNTESGTINGDTLGGAGIVVRGAATPLIANNLIRHNAINRNAMYGGSGGGILVFAAGATIVNNLLYGNTAVTGGGGVAIENFGLYSSNVQLINNTIADNSTQPLDNGAITVGGEQLVFAGSFPVYLLNNVLSGTSTVPMMVCFESPSPVNPSQPLPVQFITNDVFNGNGPTTGGFSGSSCNYPVNVDGNLSADPGFVNASGADYHLPRSSPGVDTGSNGAVTLASQDNFTFTTDLDGNPRVVDGTGKGTPFIDMGAYEYQPEPPTTLSLVCNPNSIPIGGRSILNAAITATGTTPTGTLALTDNGTALAQLPLTNGTSTYTYIGQTAGTHTLNVTFASTPTLGATSAACTVTVVGLASTSVLSASPTSTSYGSPVTLAVNVSPAPPPGQGDPSGIVTFLNGSAPLGTATLSGGVASFTTSILAGGTNSLTCAYAGDPVYAPSTCNVVSVFVAGVPTTLTLNASPNPVLAGAPFTLMAHLAMANGLPAPAGTPLQLTIASTAPVSLTLDATGSAAYTSDLSQPGSYSLTAAFAGSPNLLPSSASFTEIVTALATTTTLVANPSPAYQGQPVTLTATAAGAQTPAGNVTFSDGTTTLGTAPLDASGQATLTTNSLAPGTHTLTASFPTAGAFLGSASAAISEVILTSGFALNLTPSAITVQAGQKGTVAVALTSLGNFAGPLALSFGAMPAYAGASFAPGTITLAAGSNGTASLLLTTSSVSAKTLIPARPGSRSTPLIFSAMFLLPLGLVRSRRLRSLLCLCCAAVLLQTLSGCTTIRTPFNLVAAGTYRIPITATDATGHSQAATLTLVITP
ncbi:MAG: Ig-like domain repeat protein [Janthinobacterium lividum]